MNKSLPPTLELDDDWTDVVAQPAAPVSKPKAVPSSPPALPTPVVPGTALRAPGPARAAPQRRAGAQLENSVCAFWLGRQCFGLDVTLVGEVVNVDSVLPVPLAPAPLLGLFNLRGTAVALVDLAEVLALRGTRAERSPTTGPQCALVLRAGELVAAAWIDRMEAVISPARGSLTRPSDGDSAVVKGFVDVPDRTDLVVTLLDSNSVVTSLRRLRFTHA